MISVRPAFPSIVRRGRNLNVAIFSHTIDIINVKLCTVVPFIKLYAFILFLVTLSVLQGHSSVQQF